MKTPQTKIFVILGAVLLAVVVVSIAVLMFLPSSDSEPKQANATPPPATTTSTAQGLGFDLGVLQTRGYLGLDVQPITEGALPVLPPATTGKANPFL